MPNLRGTTYAEAVEKLNDNAGHVSIKAAYGDEYANDTNNDYGFYGNWKVCFQSIEAGKALRDTSAITLYAVEEGDICPSSEGMLKNPMNDPYYVAPDTGSYRDDESGSWGSGSDEDYNPGDEGGCPPGGCYNPCPPGGCQ
jgi:PASTA domain.